ncbi:hypothetical protein [Amycolatopsis sp. lyj-84]|uniref:hypothetical protein n=1 Tax=Amycolatopsis sp. lyj-84 TaxID=2789284 RepID=UPI003979CE96
MIQVAWAIFAALILLVTLATVAPALILRLLLIAYPRGHEQRDELIAELSAVRFWDRPTWVLEQFETALSEGISERRLAARRRRADKNAPKLMQDEPSFEEESWPIRPSDTESLIGDLAVEVEKINIRELLKADKATRFIHPDGVTPPFDFMGPVDEGIHVKYLPGDSSHL